MLGLNGGRLRFDFAVFNEKNKLSHLIEYDGIQHFNKNCFSQTNNDFNQLKAHDNLKDEYCKNHNIKLVRINYKMLKSLNIKDLMV